MTAPTCFQHPDVPATTRCGGCSQPLCSGCAVFEGGRDRCPACVAKYWRARKLQQGLLIAAGVAVLGVGVMYLTRSGVLPAGDAPGASLESCDRTKAAAYVQKLFAAEDWRGTVRSADDFVARCGKFPQLRSVTYSAHMRLSEFDLAIQDATELIESAPRNAGHYVWRGMAYESIHATDKPLADFEEAFRLKPELFQTANQLATAYEKQDRPCDGYFVLLEHAKANPAISGEAKFEKRLLQLKDQDQKACLNKQNKYEGKR